MPSTLITLASFNNTNGASPSGPLIEDSSGNLFGTTGGVGGNGNGTVYELARGSSTVTVLGSFANGEYPSGGLVEDSSGNLFGTTLYGGVNSYGTVFELAHGSSTITTLAVFYSTNNTNGIHPNGSLVEDSSGNLFGTTNSGGGPGYGTVFELAHGSSTITTLASFNTGAGNGAYPTGGLVEDGSGNLFGTTGQGGAYNVGTVFELAHGSSTITTLASFNNSHNVNGVNPTGSLVEDSSGNLFGTTQNGGAYNYGTVFELAHGSSTITTLAYLTGTNGANPQDGLVEDSSGNLFGTTPGGGANNFGTVFELAQGSSTITTLASFNSTSGANPSGSLVEDSSGAGRTITARCSSLIRDHRSPPSRKTRPPPSAKRLQCRLRWPPAVASRRSPCNGRFLRIMAAPSAILATAVASAAPPRPP